MWRQQQKNDFEFISELFGSTIIMGTILKINCDSGMENYIRTAGDPMAEDTLIVGDDENNVILCFKECSNLCHKKTTVQNVNAMLHFDYGKECIVHKRRELANIPDRLVNIVFQNNTVHNVTNNFNRLQINSHLTQCLDERARIAERDQRVLRHESTQGKHMHSNAENFLFTFYIRGGMIPLKQVKNNPEWKKEYEANMVIKRVHICKSCKGKAYKGCCSWYSPENRSKVTMVMGWSAQ